MAPNAKRVFYVKYLSGPVFGQILAKRPDIQLNKLENETPDAEAEPILSQAHAYQIGASRQVIGKHLQVTDALLAKTPNLVAVSSNGAGYDTIDVDACTRAGIIVVNQSGGNKEAVAEHALAMLLTLSKRIIEVDREGKIVHQIALTVDHPSSHSDTRMARKLDNGHYLVCHETDGVVREYDDAGKVVWSYALDLAGRPRSPGHGPEGHGNQVFGAIRLPNGNTLMAAGNGNRIIEVNPAGTIVWSIEHDELPGITLAWTTTLELLPNGNLIFGNCHAGPDNPQLIEVTRDKKVVWTFKDFEHFGNSLACAQVLGIEGRVIR